jgi:hypothetical protein
MWRDMRIASDMVRVCLNCGLWVAKSHPDIDRYFPYSCRPVLLAENGGVLWN